MNISELKKAQHKDKKIGGSNRSFGFVFSTFFLIITLVPLYHGGGIRYWALIISAVFLVLSLIKPTVMGPLNLRWTKFGHFLNQIVSPITLGVIFYGVITLFGFVIRLIGKNPLRLKFDPKAGSYWIERAPSEPTAESLKNQF